MSIPQIRTEAIEAVGRKILMEYDPSLLSGQPCPVPIETIIETKFDLILEFHTLRKNPKILYGFCRCQKAEVGNLWNKEGGCGQKSTGRE